MIWRIKNRWLRALVAWLVLPLVAVGVLLALPALMFGSKPWRGFAQDYSLDDYSLALTARRV